MKHAAPIRVLKSIALFLAIVLLTSCNGYIFGDKPPRLSDPSHVRPVADVLLPISNETGRLYGESEDSVVWLDISEADSGYVAAYCASSKQARLVISSGDEKYPYVLSPNGETEYFPLTMGNGQYTIKIYEHVEGSSYKEIVSCETMVVLENDFAPYLLPNVLVEYDSDDAVVQLAYQLAEHTSTDLEIVQQTYYWVANNISYDNDKAAASIGVTFDIMPDIEQILAERKGICIDYAVLTAALLRINGIPCKVEIGMVQSPEGGWISHAWNSIWIAEEGKISTNLTAKPNSWNHIDVTFVSTGGHTAYKVITDDSNYILESEH